MGRKADSVSNESIFSGRIFARAFVWTLANLFDSQKAAKISGPLPPPGMLEAYERVVSGSAERLLSMAEKEQGAKSFAT